MINTPTAKQLNRIPKIYSTDETNSKDNVVFMHFHLDAFSWYITEHDKNTDMFFGLKVLYSRKVSAGWLFVSFDALKELKRLGQEVICEVDWEPKKVKEVLLYWEIQKTNCSTFILKKENRPWIQQPQKK